MNLSAYFNSTNTNTTSTATTDVYTKVNNILQSQNTLAPKLNAALSADQTKLSGLGQLQSALASFQSLAQGLTGSGLNLAATSSASNVVSATTSSKSVAGTYAINVNQLAQAQVLLSKTQTSADAKITQGTASKISFDFGTTTSSIFTPGGTTKTVDIASGSSLTDIAAAINKANIGVKAEVVTSDAGYALKLTSPLGAASSMRISATGDAALQSLLNHNPAGTTNLSQSVAAQDAKLSVNGVEFSSASNSTTTAIANTTLQINAKGSSELVIAQGSNQISQNVTSLVDAYNALNDKLNTLKQGDLKSEGSASRAQNQLKNILTTSSNTLEALANAGVTMQDNGKLVIDKNKLQSAINADPSSVSKLITNNGSGIADSLISEIKDLLSADGSITRKVANVNQDITSLNTQKDALEKTLTAKANALIAYYSGESSSSSTSSGDSTSFSYSLFNYF